MRIKDNNIVYYRTSRVNEDIFGRFRNLSWLDSYKTLYKHIFEELKLEV